MKNDRGFGLSFENQTFDARTATTDDTLANRLTVFTAGPEMYLMFGTQSNATRMLSVGAGLAQIGSRTTTARPSSCRRATGST